LVDAFQAFKTSWDAFAPTDAERLAALQQAYITNNPNPLGSKDQLDYAPGYEAYHATHKQYHPAWRATLYERNYYDIFMLDLEGNLVYSVYKELDYATNFQTGEWASSGLGEAFRAAIADPDVVSEIPWKPYGPSFGALASFLSTGIKDSQGNLIGVFSTQFPPSAKPSNTAVLAPFHDLKAHAADATCVFMYTVKHLLLHEGKTMDEIRRPNAETYEMFVNHIKTGISFNGVSGKVEFMGNDKPAYLAVRQVREGAELLVGAKYMNSSSDLTINDGPSNESWNPAFPDPPPPASNFPYWAFQAFVPIMCVCCPAIAGCIRST
jgi:hypothetical protein